MKITAIKDCDTFYYLRQYLIESQQDFKSIRSGSTERIIHKDRVYLLTNISGNAGNGFHLSQLVKKDGDTWLQTNTPAVCGQNYKTQLFSPVNIRSVIGVPTASFDINSCYWKTAHRLGYITERTYVMGRRKKEWKIGRNASIGSLASTKVMIPFVKGRAKLGMRELIEPKEEYKWIRNHIISYVYRMFLELIELLGTDFYMFLTDCVFFNTNRINDVREFFDKYEYTVKSNSVEFTELDLDNRIIHWLSLKKNQHKYYTYSPHQLI